MDLRHKSIRHSDVFGDIRGEGEGWAIAGAVAGRRASSGAPKAPYELVAVRRRQDFGAQQMIMTEHAATRRNSPLSW